RRRARTRMRRRDRRGRAATALEAGSFDYGTINGGPCGHGRPLAILHRDACISCTVRTERVRLRPRATDAASAISIEAVTCRFGDVRALDALSFEAETSKVTGIVGPNGAGKTTLIDVLSGLIRPSSGHVRVLGHDVRSDPLIVRSRIGVVAQ